MKKAGAWVGILLAVWALGPLVQLAFESFAGGWYWPALFPREWTLRAWAYVFSPAAELKVALFNSLFIGLGVAAGSVALATPAARALALHSFRGKRAILWCLLLPAVAPPLASTMGLHRMLLVYGLTETAFGVALAHLVPAIPYATLMLVGSFNRFDPELESQARTLGAPRWAVWRYVTLPAIAPGLAVAFCLCFLVSWSQYLLTLLIGGGHVLTLPLELVAFQRGGDESIAAALSLVVLAPAVTGVVIVGRYLRN
jgi:putative spermidine/putrescine transport system permease protein